MISYYCAKQSIIDKWGSEIINAMEHWKYNYEKIYKWIKFSHSITDIYIYIYAMKKATQFKLWNSPIQFVRNYCITSWQLTFFLMIFNYCWINPVYRYWIRSSENSEIQKILKIQKFGKSKYPKNSKFRKFRYPENP